MDRFGRPGNWGVYDKGRLIDTAQTKPAAQSIRTMLASNDNRNYTIARMSK